MFDTLIVTAVLVAYLVIGAVVARRHSQDCFRKACAKWPEQSDRITAYHTWKAGYILGWLVLLPVGALNKFTDAPVGNLEAASQGYNHIQQRDALGHAELKRLPRGWND